MEILLFILVLVTLSLSIMIFSGKAKIKELNSLILQLLDAQKRVITRLDTLNDSYIDLKRDISKFPKTSYVEINRGLQPHTEQKYFPEQKEEVAASTTSTPPPLPHIESVYKDTNKNDLVNAASNFKRPQPPTNSTSTEKQTNTYTNYEAEMPHSPFVSWLKEDWLMKIGSFMVLLAIGWFVTYAFLNNWIGPAGRIAVGAITGIGLMALGSKRIEKFHIQGSVFLAIGTTIIIISMFAACNFYTLMPSLVGLAISAIALGLLAAKAISKQSKSLFYLSLCLSTLCPFLFGFYMQKEFVIGYLLVLISANAYVNWKWNIPELPLISSIIAFLYSAPYIILELNNWQPPSIATLSFAFLSLGLIISQNLQNLQNLQSFAGYRDPEKINESDDSVSAINIISSAICTICIIGWSMKIGTETTPGYIIAGWSLIFATISRILYTKTKNVKGFYLTWSLSTILALLSIKIILNLPEITLGFLALSIATIIVAHRLNKEFNTNPSLPIYASYSLLLPCLTAIQSIASQSWKITPLNKDMLVLTSLSITLFIIGLWFKKLNLKENNQERKLASNVILILASIYSYVIIWLTLTNLLPINYAIACSLSIYTTAGLTCYFQGIVKDRQVLRKYGLILVTLVISRLFLVDLWNMETAGRIITFLAVGILLVSTAFFRKKEKEKKYKNF